MLISRSVAPCLSPPLHPSTFHFCSSCYYFCRAGDETQGHVYANVAAFCHWTTPQPLCKLLMCTKSPPFPYLLFYSPPSNPEVKSPGLTQSFSHHTQQARNRMLWTTRIRNPCLKLVFNVNLPSEKTYYYLNFNYKY
jgi:hypothetical protein